MRKMAATACVLLLMAATSFGQQAPDAPGPRPNAMSTQTSANVPAKQKKKAKLARPQAEQPAEPTPQAAPPVPATLLNSPPVKPTVTMQNGLLTIDAPNSTLGDILAGIRKATGATIEGAIPNDRVAVKIGPGTPDQVVAALLRGTSYGYVILGAPNKPDTITRVLLTQQQQASAEPPRPAPSGQPQPQPNMVQEQPDEGMPDRTVPEDGNMQPEQQQPESDQPSPPMPPGTQIAPQAQPGAQQPDQTQQPQQQQQDQNQPKTPEQLFRELQQLEQQKNQQR